MRKSLMAVTAAASMTFAAPLAADPPLYTFGGGSSVNSSAVQYDANGNYVTPQTLGENDKVWMDADGQYRCKRKNGTTGMVIGAAIGGFLGNRIAGRGKRTLGTIIGAVGGGLLGKSLTDGEVKCQ
ncbi:MAG: glycine zipper 2TM domain-containing protein [Novosphingobium sp.]